MQLKDQNNRSKFLWVYGWLKQLNNIIGAILLFLFALCFGIFLFFIDNFIPDGEWQIDPVISKTIIVVFFGTFLLLVGYRIKILLSRNFVAGSTQTDLAATSGRPLKHVSEDIQLFIPGIIRINAYLGGASSGTLSHPENALLLTSDSICFVYVPMVGGDNTINFFNFAHLYFNKSGIKDNFDRMVKESSVNEVINSDPRNWVVPLSEIEAINFSKHNNTISVTTKTDSREYGTTNKLLFDQLRTKLGALGIAQKSKDLQPSN
jgi:hypothetical protein